MRWIRFTIVFVISIILICTEGHKFYLPENKQKRDIGKRQEHELYYYLSEKWV